MAKKFTHRDPILESAVNELLVCGCHTVLLYGSRARGDFWSGSDYDLMAVRKGGASSKFAENKGGSYIDAFIFTEKELKPVGERHVYMKGAKVLIETRGFGTKFLKQVKVAARKKPPVLPKHEASARRVWIRKMLERAKVGDIEGNYRRTWLLESLLPNYFLLRNKRYWGSKLSFQWLKKYDRATYILFDRAYRDPRDLKILISLANRVSR
jgi:hypothetical protein